MGEVDLKPAWVDRGPGHTPWAATGALGSGNRKEPICQAPSQAALGQETGLQHTSLLSGGLAGSVARGA